MRVSTFSLWTVVGMITDFNMEESQLISLQKFALDFFRLGNEWVEFAFYAMDPATGGDAHRLRQLCRPGSMRPNCRTVMK